MELVIRQSERSGHQQRLLQAFTEDVFQLTRVHSVLELSGRCALQIYLLTYLLTYLAFAGLSADFENGATIL